jgi:hypothetical protein
MVEFKKYIKNVAIATIAILTAVATITSVFPIFSQEQNTQIPSSKTTISQEIAKNPNSSEVNTNIYASKIIGLSSETIKAIDTFKQLNPITTAEDIFEGNKWSQSLIAEYYDVLNPNDIGKYLYMGEPSSVGLKGDASLNQNNGRADFYKVVKVPKFAIRGFVSKEKFTDTNGLISIPEGIKNNNQFAKIELGSEQEGFYTIKVTGTDDKINSKNIYLNAIVFKDEVNVDNNKDDFRTRILKRVTYKYIFINALGKSVKVENGKIILQNFDLNISKEEQPNCKIVIFGQDKNTCEMYFSGYIDMVDGEPALFNIDNLSSSTVDLKEVVKYTSLNDLESKIYNKPEYQEKVGYEKKTISVTNVKDLKYLSLQLDYTPIEAQIYQVLTAGINPELKDKVIFKYDPIKNQVNITFLDPINGDKKLFYFYIKINEATTKGFKDEDGGINKNVNFKFSEFNAYDSSHFEIKHKLREQKAYFPVRMCTIENPSDFNHDTWVDEKDVNLMVKHFGLKFEDEDFEAAYDLVKDDRIDILDLVTLLGEVNQQNVLLKEIKNLNPGYKPNNFRADVIRQKNKAV